MDLCKFGIFSSHVVTPGLWLPSKSHAHGSREHLVNPLNHSQRHADIINTTNPSIPLTLLLADTDSATSSASSLGVLTTNSETPEVTETTMGSDLLQSFQIFTKLALHAVGQHLTVLAIGDITLSVEEPCWNLVLSWTLNDCDNPLELFRCEFTSATEAH